MRATVVPGGLDEDDRERLRRGVQYVECAGSKLATRHPVRDVNLRARDVTLEIIVPAACLFTEVSPSLRWHVAVPVARARLCCSGCPLLKRMVYWVEVPAS